MGSRLVNRRRAQDACERSGRMRRDDVSGFQRRPGESCVDFSPGPQNNVKFSCAAPAALGTFICSLALVIILLEPAAPGSNLLSRPRRPAQSEALNPPSAGRPRLQRLNYFGGRPCSTAAGDIGSLVTRVARRAPRSAECFRKPYPKKGNRPRGASPAGAASRKSPQGPDGPPQAIGLSSQNNHGSRFGQAVAI